MTWQWIVVGIVVVYAMVRLGMGISRSLRKGGDAGCAGCALAEQCAKRKAPKQSGCRENGGHDCGCH